MHYARPLASWLLAMSVVSAVFAGLEIVLLGYLGTLIDRMAELGPDQFLALEGSRLAFMGVLLLLVLPALAVIGAFIMYQALMGNFPQRVRWMGHRWLIGQSMRYFQDEFAGRIATRLMQTSLAVRETVMKLMDVAVYILAYFIGTLALAATLDWRLALPFALWALAYGGMLAIIVPRLGRVAQAQADARAEMTGRIVDSYTNIATVKLFSHSAREEAFARDGMDGFLQTVYRQMRLVAVQDMTVNTLNALLTGAVTAIGLWLWLGGNLALGALAVAIPLALRLGKHVALGDVGIRGVVREYRTVRDGLSTLSQPRDVGDAPGAKPLALTRGEIRFDAVRFEYDATSDPAPRRFGRFGPAPAPRRETGAGGPVGCGGNQHS